MIVACTDVYRPICGGIESQPTEGLPLKLKHLSVVKAPGEGLSCKVKLFKYVAGRFIVEYSIYENSTEHLML